MVATTVRRPAGDTRFDGLAVLLVEDNVRLRGMIARTLESLGCTVVAAGDGGEAMRLLQAVVASCS